MIVKFGVIVMYMKLKDGKSKVLTLSYDDGVVQDIRFIEMLNKYGVKATFNINTGLYAPEELQREKFYGRMKFSEAKELYTDSGHEIAVHGLTHPHLQMLTAPEIITEVLEDRRNIEKQYGTIAKGMAYPYGVYNDTVVNCLKMCGISYCRTCKTTGKLTLPGRYVDNPDEWLLLDPTCHHNDSRLMELAEKFVNGKRFKDDIWMFYLFGHTYEFDNDDNWDVIEEFIKFTSGKEDIWYATNIEIYDYIKAFKSLKISVDKTVIENPTSTDLWFTENDVLYCVKAGETLRI